jgi:hypothetical protein
MATTMTRKQSKEYQTRIGTARAYVSDILGNESRRYAEDYLAILLTADYEPDPKAYSIPWTTARDIRVVLGGILGEYAR